MIFIILVDDIFIVAKKTIEGRKNRKADKKKVTEPVLRLSDFL
jgi:hypothetical protein